MLAFRASIFDCCARLLTTFVMSPICWVCSDRDRIVWAMPFIASRICSIPWTTSPIVTRP